jgi:hypothetical protein
MTADEKFAVSSIGCGIVSFLFFQFNRNAKLKKALFIWFEVGLGLIFLTWFSMRIWQSFHSIAILVVFLLPAILILALIMLMNAKKQKSAIRVEEQFTQAFSLSKTDAAQCAVLQSNRF